METRRQPNGDAFDGDFGLDSREYADLEAELALRDFTVEELVGELEARGWGLNKRPKNHTFKTPSATVSPSVPHLGDRYLTTCAPVVYR